MRHLHLAIHRRLLSILFISFIALEFQLGQWSLHVTILEYTINVRRNLGKIFASFLIRKAPSSELIVVRILLLDLYGILIQIFSFDQHLRPMLVHATSSMIPQLLRRVILEV